MMLMMAVLMLVACGNKEENEPAKQNESASNEVESEVESEDSGAVEIEKNLLSVEVTVPASMIDSDDIDQVIAEAKADGVGEVTKNSDGSLTYKMSKSKHKEMMNEMAAELKSSIEEMTNGEDFSSIKDITPNKTFSEFTMIVDQDVYENSFDGFATLGLGIGGMMYQLFDGVKSDDYKVTIHVKDETTGEEFATVVYPDDMEE